MTALHRSHDLDHLNDQILGWWYRNGVDDEAGGVCTCFSNDGQLLSTDKYTWSQGRWAWLMGRIARDGTGRFAGAEHAQARAVATADFLAAHAVLPDGSTVYQLTGTGAPVPQAAGALHTSVYADLFTVLGFAGAIGAVHDARSERWSTLAHRVLASAADRIAHGTALSEPYPVPRGMTSLGARMMLLNAASELHAATGSAEAAAVAQRSGAELVDACTADPGRLPADFARTGGPDGTLLLRHRTPGHVLEALWFLVDAAQRFPALAGDWVVPAADLALRQGWDEEYGGLLRYVDVDGGPPRGTDDGSRYGRLVRSTWSTKLWWPHAEALYATALLAHTYGSDRMRSWHERVREYTFATFPVPGREWVQIRDRASAPLDEVVALPVKDPFHIARALLLSCELEQPRGRTT